MLLSISSANPPNIGYILVTQLFFVTVLYWSAAEWASCCVQYTLPSFMDAFRRVQAALESGLERDVE